MSVVERSVLVVNLAGLHARPCHQLANIALRHQSRIEVSCDGQRADGRSILSLMTLAAPRGAKLVLRAEGEDAQELVQSLECAIAGGFGEQV